MTLAAEAAGMGVWMWSIASNQVWGSEQWLRLFGFAPDATVTFESIIERIHPTTAKRWSARCGALEDQDDYPGDFRVILPDGTQRWVVARGRMHPDAHGNPTQMLGVAIDITERKQTDAAMHDLSRRLIRAHEAERARLGRELHDDVTQRLAILAIDAGRVERSADRVLVAETVRGIREGLVRLSEDIHALSYRLHPALLEDLGLTEALKAECERFSRQESVPAAVTLRDLPEVVPPETALCLFRWCRKRSGTWRDTPKPAGWKSRCGGWKTVCNSSCMTTASALIRCSNACDPAWVWRACGSGCFWWTANSTSKADPVGARPF